MVERSASLAWRHHFENAAAPRMRAIARLAERSTRTRQRQFLVEGPQAVRELLKFRPELVVDLYLTQSAADRYPELGTMAVRQQIFLHSITAAVSDSLGSANQGVIAVARLFPLSDLGDHLQKNDTASSPLQIAVFDTIRDPGNAGTAIRVADAVGAAAVAFTGNTVDVFSPKVIRASAGSFFHLPIISAELAQIVETCRRHGIVSIATVVGAKQFVGTEVLPARIAWIFGNEANGLSAEARRLADRDIAIPIFGQAESLNIATAAAVCLYTGAFAQGQETLDR